jgi:hypothetical protein
MRLLSHSPAKKKTENSTGRPLARLGYSVAKEAGVTDPFRIQ